MKLQVAITLLISVGLISACSIKFDGTEKKANVVPIGSVAPDIDFSNENPDCLTAAQRIEDYVVEGMVLADVRRLVGQPRVTIPGSWWWTESFSPDGRPFVKYGFGAAKDSVPITSFGTDTTNCSG